MSIFKVYVGDLDDPEFRANESRTDSFAHPPQALSPNLPLRDGYLAFNLVCKIGSGEFAGRQLHSGCWVARVTRAQIVHFIYEYYIWWQLYHHYEDGAETPLDECAEILNCIKNLDAGKDYGLVACECLGSPGATPFEAADYHLVAKPSFYSSNQKRPAS